MRHARIKHARLRLAALFLMPGLAFAQDRLVSRPAERPVELPVERPVDRPVDRPLVVPLRDVGITYRSPAQPGAELRMSWLVAEQKLRVDMPGGQGWSLVDQRAQRMVLVMERQRMLLELPTGSGGINLPAQPPEGARFTRAGSATVAGLACTVWRYADGKGTGGEGSGETCLTADGVMLRSSGTHGGRTGTVEAVEVSYGPQDPERFRIPPGYQAVPRPAR